MMKMIHESKTYFIDTDASSNDGVSYHNQWMERGIAVLSGGPKYERKIERLKRGDTLLLWASGEGVVACGMVVDDAPVKVISRAEIVSPREPEEYHRKVAWTADLRTRPITAKEVIAYRGANPRGSIQALETGRAEIMALALARAEEIDLAQIGDPTKDRVTEVEALRQARRGQGKYRDDLLNLWNRKCAVTCCDLEQVLRASHALPWAASTNEQRLDPNNGLPLLATLDALFDSGLIGFADDGTMLCSPVIQAEHAALFGVPVTLRQPLNPAQKEYLAAHRRRFAL
ncbi:HNH endonuclease [Paraburkholderia terrae]|uniref:HNH endonuclease n=1 Tax=Paraburkholderia terrae TaxID=311230 RepID=UPI0020C1184F|nr:HNH endonuclease signature motif containing protein [Paraburkholderia terrae]